MCSDCDKSDQVRCWSGGLQGLAVRHQRRGQPQGDILRPQEEKSREEGGREGGGEINVLILTSDILNLNLGHPQSSEIEKISNVQ